MHCTNMSEAYQARRSTRTGTSADSHLELARWCLQHELLEQASRELQIAREIDPRHPGLAALEMQLRQFVDLAASSPEAIRTPSAPPLSPSAPANVAIATPFEVTAEARARFVRSIQPMLIHTCATGGCHQPGGRQRLQLDRWALAGNGDARLVRRNLASTLNVVFKDNPAKSLIVIRAAEAHGDGKDKSRALDARQMTILREWLNEACGVTPDRLTGEEAPATAAPQESAPGPAEFAARGEPPFVPRDAFDAEIFNRRQSPPAADATAQSQSAAR
jgi:hypothetical protein